MILLVRFFSFLWLRALRGGREREEGGEGARGQAMEKKIWGERRLDEKAGEVERRGGRMDGYLDW